jgi:formiminotetrahydrofolate cyclodeaminase
MINYKNLKGKVEYCLDKYEECRNSDRKLSNAIIVNFYHSKLKEIDGQHFINIIDRYEIPKDSDIERIRRKFNEKNLYLPTDINVVRQRKINEQEWRIALGYKY